MHSSATLAVRMSAQGQVAHSSVCECPNAERAQRKVGPACSTLLWGKPHLALDGEAEARRRHIACIAHARRALRVAVPDARLGFGWEKKPKKTTVLPPPSHYSHEIYTYTETKVERCGCRAQGTYLAMDRCGCVVALPPPWSASRPESRAAAARPCPGRGGRPRRSASCPRRRQMRGRQ